MSRGIFAAGSDTIAFENVPASEMPVHIHLLVESGIHIIENLNLEDLARDRVYEFVFGGRSTENTGRNGSSDSATGFRTQDELFDNLDPIVFDHGIGEDTVGDRLDLRLCPCVVGISFMARSKYLP